MITYLVVNGGSDQRSKLGIQIPNGRFQWGADRKYKWSFPSICIIVEDFPWIWTVWDFHGNPEFFAWNVNSKLGKEATLSLVLSISWRSDSWLQCCFSVPLANINCKIRWFYLLQTNKVWTFDINSFVVPPVIFGLVNSWCVFVVGFLRCCF